MRYALFLGCTVPVRGMNYELSARKVADRLGIELVDIPDFSCCGFPVKSVDIKTALVLSAKNLALAEKEGLDLVTLCSACASVLAEANEALKEDEELRNIINQELDIPYNGTIEVYHFVRILWEKVGPQALKEQITKPLSGIRVGAHYGCHYIKPSEVYGFDDPENPVSLDVLIEATGAESVWYDRKLHCCGGGILGIEEGIALAMSKVKLDALKKEGVDALISICPFCTVMYEGNQRKIEKTFDTKYGIPVLYYTQLLGLALGIPPEELGFNLNRVKPKDLLAKIS